MVAELTAFRISGRVHRVGRAVSATTWGSCVLLALTMCAPLHVRAASANEVLPDAAALGQLEQQAMAAQPREQCFLFSELVHDLTEQAGREIAQGQEEQAQATLKHTEIVLAKMHIAVQQDAKRLKNAEIIMEHSSRRLSDMLHVASEASRGAVASTLQKLNVLHSELLAQVFAK